MDGLVFFILLLVGAALLLPIGLIVLWVSISGLKRRLLQLEYTADALQGVQRQLSQAVLDLHRAVAADPPPAHAPTPVPTPVPTPPVPHTQPSAQGMVFERAQEAPKEALPSLPSQPLPPLPSQPLPSLPPLPPQPLPQTPAIQAGSSVAVDEAPPLEAKPPLAAPLKSVDEAGPGAWRAQGEAHRPAEVPGEAVEQAAQQATAEAAERTATEAAERAATEAAERAAAEAAPPAFYHDNISDGLPSYAFEENTWRAGACAEQVPAGFLEKALQWAKRWFSEGNVPVKIGVLVFLAGVLALLKYAVEQEWFVFPIEFRLAGIAALSLAALAFAWKQRQSRRVFALSVQGGAIGVLLMTAFAAYKWYALVPAPVAFAVSVALIAGVGVLSVLQNARALAIFGILSGFMAPLWLSTGSHNHVALFAYYALLNAGILGIAWHRSWRGLNLLGFAFTFGIGAAWGVWKYAPQHFASTQPFLLLFFLFYVLMPMLYARKRAARRKDIVDGSLLFGTPLVVFILQAGLFEFERMPLAFSALGLGALYAALAAAFLKKAHYAALGQAYAMLSVGFATLAVPLAFSAQSTACIFALEGAGLLWWGLRQKRLLPRLTGIGLQLCAGCALWAADVWLTDAGYASLPPAPFANAGFMSALLMAVAGFASAGCYAQAARKGMARLFYAWALAWWCGNALHEISVFIPTTYAVDALLVLAVATGWLAAEVFRHRPRAELGLTTLLAFASALPLVFVQVEKHAHPFADYGLAAWGIFAVLGFRSLWCLRAQGGRIAAWTQSLWWLLWALALSTWLNWLGAAWALGEGWGVVGTIAPCLALAALSLLRWRWLRFPQGLHFDKARPVFQTGLFVALALWWLYALFSRADSTPLPWLPLLNPLELTQVAVWALAVYWLQQTRSHGAGALSWTALSMALFTFVSVAVLRTGHQWGSASWGLASLLADAHIETSLTVVWSILGVAGWVAGSRKKHWKLWLMGALLMGAVLAKLVLIDRTNLGNIFGIASFIVYGVLCIATGYFAPAPPRLPLKHEEPHP